MPSHLVTAALITLTPILANPFPVYADEIILIPSADTTLFQPSPNNNLGATVDLVAGKTRSGSLAHALIKFDLAGSIPAHATITSAQLNVRVVKQPSFGRNDSTFELHRVLRDWGEGENSTAKNGAPATTGECNWNFRFATSTPWGIPGGEPGTDYSPTVSASRPITSPAAYTFSSTPDLVADLQAWLDSPTANFGWMILSQSEATTSGTARRIASREHPTTAFRPVLVVAFAPPLTLQNVQIVNPDIQFQFEGKAGSSYLAQKRSAVEAGQWTTLMTIPTLTQNQTITVTDDVQSGNTFYRVEIQ